MGKKDIHFFNLNFENQVHFDAGNTQDFHIHSVLYDLQKTFQTITNLSLLCYWLALACYLDTIHIHTQS